jgi:hypothetical protein
MSNEQQYQTIFDLAHKAGLDASNNTKPAVAWIPGVAWIVIDGTSEFSRWTKKKGLSRQGTYKGREISSSKLVPDHLDHKEAYVRAFAKVLNLYAIKASEHSRLD